MRRKKTFNREINPDPKYGSVLVTKFINKLMEGGKKSIVQNIFYTALEIVAKNLKKDLKVESLRLTERLLRFFSLSNARYFLKVR